MPTNRAATQTQWHWASDNESFALGRVVFYDSEFVREKSYFPKLALMQWQEAGAAEATLCDPLSAQPPWQALLHHSAPLVMHSGSQDLELIRQETGYLPSSVRDTQIGFALCHPQLTVSFAEMVEYYLDAVVDKSATRSDWLKRPLDAKQLDYAANDVGLLSRVYPLLCAELSQLERLSWWAEECRYLLDHQATVQLQQQWFKLRNAPKLKGQETAIAALLHTVREHIARDKNWPRRKVLDDGVIFDIAQSGIEQADELAEFLDSAHLIFSKQSMLDEGFAQIAKPYPVIPRSPRLNNKQRELFNRLDKRSHEVAEVLGIHVDMLSTQKNLRYFAAGEAGECKIDRGWRRQFFSDLLG
ncbi:ribonuclease D [Cardiobacteriaceae bacterium TAE3-ERU3]|nr:ribonuclease D [Cardiobacteriaceae bacterium TAE3-ERU3]